MATKPNLVNLARFKHADLDNLVAAWDRLREYAAPRNLRTEWIRTPGPTGQTLGATWRHRHAAGWSIQRCGHPTAHCPYYITDPAGAIHLADNGRAFRRLLDAKTKLLDLAGQALAHAQ